MSESSSICVIATIASKTTVANQAEFWTTVGVWALNIIGTMVLVFLGFLFRRLGKLEGELAEVIQNYVSRKEAKTLIEEAGRYRDDKAAIAGQLDQHAKDLGRLYESVEKINESQGMINGKLDTVVGHIEHGRGPNLRQ